MPHSLRGAGASSHGASDGVHAEERWLSASGSPAQCVWSAFPVDTAYFGAGRAPWMVDYRVADLDAMLAQLRAAGAVVDDRIEESDYGRFGWAADPEGNRFELWQPPAAGI